MKLARKNFTSMLIKPIPPIKPQEKIVTNFLIFENYTNNYIDEMNISLKDIVSNLYNEDINSLSISVKIDGSYPDDNFISFKVYNKSITDNPHYFNDLELYNKAYEQYLEDEKHYQVQLEAAKQKELFDKFDVVLKEKVKLTEKYEQLKEQFKPNSLDDAFQFLDLLAKEDEDSILHHAKSFSEDFVIMSYHSTLGRKLRNDWGLWDETSHCGLKDYFHSLGITHPDDISSIVLTSYWRKVHNLDLKIEEQVQKCLDYWKFHGKDDYV